MRNEMLESQQQQQESVMEMKRELMEAIQKQAEQTAAQAV